MKTELVRITPATAAKYLTKNASPRPLRRNIVDAYKLAFERGEYVVSHQGIAFTVDGALVDGQHRLTAISEMPANFSAEMLMTTGLSAESARVMDIGFKRTAADILGENKKTVEVARFLAYLYSGNQQGLTPTYLIPYVDAVREPHAKLMAFCGHVTRMWSSAPIRSAACLVILAGGDADYTLLMYRALVTKDYDTLSNAGKAFMRSHDIGKVRADAAIDAFARALVVFNPRKADIKKVQISDTSSAVEAMRVIVRRKILNESTREERREHKRVWRRGGDPWPLRT